MGRKKKIEFQIPQKTLDQINEFSAGGYVLFTFDENGNPKITSQFDSLPHSAAMQHFISNWVETLSKINIKMIYESMCGPRRPSQEDGELGTFI